jgi:Rad3-related DNA helicase
MMARRICLLVIVVFDEAHQLPDTATSMLVRPYFNFQLTEPARDAFDRYCYAGDFKDRL